MKKTTHELARELLGMPDKPLAISIDVSTDDVSTGDRALSIDYLGHNGLDTDEIVLLFEGYRNF